MLTKNEFNESLHEFLSAMPKSAKRFKGAQSLASFSFSVGFRKAMEVMAEFGVEHGEAQTEPAQVAYKLNDLVTAVDASLSTHQEYDGE